MKVLLLAACLVGASLAQQAGQQNPTETKPTFQLSVCQEGGSCTTEDTKLVLDANWRWTHEVRIENFTVSVYLSRIKYQGVRELNRSYSCLFSSPL